MGTPLVLALGHPQAQDNDAWEEADAAAEDVCAPHVQQQHEPVGRDAHHLFISTAQSLSMTDASCFVVSVMSSGLF